mmetsp:Transcript_4443/g.11498  ORF Transcript_4443/g.11498 Transcript_4443/m.11498 type:complete len:433 (+) Transcript_4443:39-1337(+)|eukprot:CAMPEP_0119414714 /NCGR_PEP_ID=MMETSP1335-20130426/7137_1 /TAXON_ID=259385 /ORGANISM="Chrysoculter rhomboideus, Strain RCC1486" /LENGTH=432 /DNA_ID=CAMNT_0007439601 /DNA_START=38 /DNA_END=1336 /DNA_ORIENTATION=+
MRVRSVLILALGATIALTSYPTSVRADVHPEDDEDFDGGDYGEDDDYTGGDDDYMGDDDYDPDSMPPPATELKELTTAEEFDSFLDNEDASVVGFFAEEGDALDAFKSSAQTLAYDFRFAYTTSAEVLSKYKYKSAAVVFKPPRFVNDKYDKPKARFPGTNFSNSDALKIFLREASLPLVGQLTYNTKERYSARGIPLVKVFFDVDYTLNPKGSNYYVNRVRKVAAEYVGKLSFAIAAIKDYSWETSDYGLSLEEGKKQVGVGIEDGDKRYGMGEEEFSVVNLKAFCEKFLAGELEPTKVVETPDYNSYGGGGGEGEEDGDVDESAVTVLTPDNFKEEVTESGKDAMVEFYAPWCGHCKMLKPEYAKLGQEFAGDDSVVIAKMDADEHQAPEGFDVQGFPTIFYVPKGGKPVSYDGERSADAMAEFIRKQRA